MSSDLRVAVLGSGSMGTMHARNLAAIEGVRVVGVCGTSVAKAAKLIETNAHAGAEPFDDFAAMLRRTRPHALVVALPPFAHAGQTELAARQGIHLFLEKPVEKSVEGARSILRAADKVTTLVVHHQRFGAMVRRVAGAIASGDAGKLTLVQGRWFCNALHGPWWRDLAKSGGQVVEQAVHTYDLACHFARLAGGHPTSVSGLVANLTKTHIPGYTVEDTHASLIAFSNGAMASMCASNAAVPKKWASTLTVVCERLTAEIRTQDEGTLTWTEGKPSEAWPKDTSPRTEEVRGQTELYVEAANAFITAVRAGHPPAPPAATLHDALTALEVVWAIATSSANNGRQITLPLPQAPT